LKSPINESTTIKLSTRVTYTMTTTNPPHPYYPTTLSLPTYTPPTLSLTTLLATALILATALVLLTWTLTVHLSPPHLPAARKASATWFLASGLLHLHFESHYLRYRRTLPARTDLLSQLWKEYALSDSRYLLPDGHAFVAGIESLTVAVVGPLCLLAFWSSVRDAPHRDPVRLLVCCLHAFCCALYFVTEMLEGGKHCRPEPRYYWGYFVACNLPWIIVPGVLGWRAFARLKKAVVLAEGRRKKA
jgi:cholestenol delta-isomerase